ncbi:hypothetical protein CANTEDRAFT_115901 [Yamadazyma tenuis ATCC 10573]|uniref:Uncharacterized protein n=1 Tax=Candida tenuis (strain ATCC 10573 / BCRC 21748 / CBS 615 / JCM 9827 / NBRC 10315 / NRRL Y-1498 / VKM Y-70) TaxID=590646 RepID=G3B914_CANTC|nr:uncharacterized protein CANTEDRAFT_115901 [Yamadazyma tenuis ATCC 10573]EGV62434.1 hypothetical protein CANTEDRAFT_115901 [Yamadazyma tenuis ATCC 10573]
MVGSIQIPLNYARQLGKALLSGDLVHVWHHSYLHGKGQSSIVPWPNQASEESRYLLDQEGIMQPIYLL